MHKIELINDRSSFCNTFRVFAYFRVLLCDCRALYIVLCISIDILHTLLLGHLTCGFTAKFVLIALHAFLGLGLVFSAFLGILFLFFYICFLVIWSCIQSGDDLTVEPKDNDNDDDDDDDHRREMMMRSSIESLANVKRLQNVANKLDGASTKLLTNFEHLERSSAQKSTQCTIAYSRWIRILYSIYLFGQA